MGGEDLENGASRLVVVVNDASQLEYDRTRRLPPEQHAGLEDMDRRMEAEGIRFGGQHIDSPSLHQRAQFMANTLIAAVRRGEEGTAAATCAWLANRLPDLRQVRAEETPEGGVVIDLVFDRDYVAPSPLRFVEPGKLDS